MLDFISNFDWISPLWAWIQDLRHWPPYTVEITGADRGGLRWPDVARMLKKQGVECWGAMWVGQRLIFTIRKRDGERVTQLLEGAGIHWR